MPWLTLIITLPLTVFSVLFAVSNGQFVEVTLWPLEQKLSLPLSLAGLGLLLGGFCCGALFVWIYAQKTRFRLWQETRRADRLEKELDLLSKKPPEPAARITAAQ